MDLSNQAPHMTKHLSSTYAGCCATEWARPLKFFEFNVRDIGIPVGHLPLHARRYANTGKIGPSSSVGWYANNGKMSSLSDVYSFGVVLLELLTGRKPFDSMRAYRQWSLVTWATPKLNEDKVKQCIDPKLNGEFHPRQAAKDVYCLEEIDFCRYIEEIDFGQFEAKPLNPNCLKLELCNYDETSVDGGEDQSLEDMICLNAIYCGEHKADVGDHNSDVSDQPLLLSIGDHNPDNDKAIKIDVTLVFVTNEALTFLEDLRAGGASVVLVVSVGVSSCLFFLLVSVGVSSCLFFLLVSVGASSLSCSDSVFLASLNGNNKMIMPIVKQLNDGACDEDEDEEQGKSGGPASKQVPLAVADTHFSCLMALTASKVSVRLKEALRDPKLGCEKKEFGFGCSTCLMIDRQKERRWSQVDLECARKRCGHWIWMRTGALDLDVLRGALDSCGC
ncbi:hypothetical protein LguiB_026138 [Lonicera macranthoides]